MPLTSDRRTQQPQDGANAQRKTSLPTQSDAEILASIDATIAGLKQHIAAEPFILTAPCAEPRYHHHSQQRQEAFCKNAPFRPDEEPLQYQSFIFRDRADGVFQTLTRFDEERERRRAHGLPESASSVPAANAGPKKKISLADYKNKRANSDRALSRTPQGAAKGTPPFPPTQPPSQPNTNPSSPQIISTVPATTQPADLKVTAQAVPRATPTLARPDPPKSSVRSPLKQSTLPPSDTTSKPQPESQLSSPTPRVSVKPLGHSSPAVQSSLPPSTQAHKVPSQLSSPRPPVQAGTKRPLEATDSTGSSHTTTSKTEVTSPPPKKLKPSPPLKHKSSPFLKPASAYKERVPGRQRDFEKPVSNFSSPKVQPTDPGAKMKVKDDIKPSGKAVERANKPDRAAAVQKITPSTKASSVSKDSGTEKASKPKSSTTKHGLPPMLSPPSYPKARHGLPPMLSSKLPAKIEARLAETEHQRDSAQSSSSSDRKGRVNGVASSAAGRSTSRSDVTNRKSQSLENPQKGVAQSIGKTKVAGVAECQKKTSLNDRHDDGDGALKSVRERLLVTFRFTNKHRRKYERILKQRQLLAKITGGPLVPSKAPIPVSTSTKGVAKAIGPSKDSSTKKSSSSTSGTGTGSKRAASIGKRSRDADDDEAGSSGPAKKARVPADLDLDAKPRTPAGPALISPTLSKGHRSRNSDSTHHLTPRRDIRTTMAMQRTASAESSAFDHGTPNGPVGTPSGAGRPPTSTSNGAAAGGGSGSNAGGSNNTAHNAESTEWQNVSKHYNQLGRRLKHQVQHLGTTFSGLHANKSELERAKKKAAVISIECMVCYFLAYSAEELSRRARHSSSASDIAFAGSTWLTLGGIFRLFGNFTKDYPHLDGLRYYLGGVSATHVLALLSTSRLHAGAPRSSSADGPSPPPVAANNNNNNSTTIVPLDPTRLQALFHESSRHFLDARKRLPWDAIMSHYPATWSSRASSVAQTPRPLSSTTANGNGLSNGTSSRTGTKGLGAGFQRDFWLPLGTDSDPVQASMFALRLLEEWKEKSGMGGGQLEANVDLS